jgi:hypothetical protein
VEGTTLIALLALILSAGHILFQIGWQILRHRRRAEDEIEVRDELRRSDVERQALIRVHAATPPAIQICVDYLEQFPEGRPPSTLRIHPRKVAARLTSFQEAWEEEAAAIRVAAVRDAHRDIGVDRVLSEIAARAASPEELVPTVEGLQSSLKALRATITETLR